MEMGIKSLGMNVVHGEKVNRISDAPIDFR